jgi:hypothetical protein
VLRSLWAQALDLVVHDAQIGGQTLQFLANLLDLGA